MGNKNKVEYISVVITGVVALAGLLLGFWFFIVISKDYQEESTLKPFKLKEEAYNKIVNPVTPPEKQLLDNNDFGRDNPFGGTN